jgi:hypothetical protein
MPTAATPIRELRGAAPDIRYIELDDLVDGLIETFRHTDGDAEDAQLLATLADTAGQLAALSPHVHDPDTEADLVHVDVGNARFARLLAEVAGARVTGHPRVGGQVAELESHPYVAAVLEQMAGQAEQPGWVLAHRLNILIDHAITAGVPTGLAQRIAHAASHRPDGENAAEHEQADGQQLAA